MLGLADELQPWGRLLRAVFEPQLNDFQEFAAGINDGVTDSGIDGAFKQVAHERAHQSGKVAACLDSACSDFKTSRSPVFRNFLRPVNCSLAFSSHPWACSNHSFFSS